MFFLIRSSFRGRAVATGCGFAAGATGETPVVPLGGVNGSILIMAQIAIYGCLLH